MYYQRVSITQKCEYSVHSLVSEPYILCIDGLFPPWKMTQRCAISVLYVVTALDMCCDASVFVCKQSHRKCMADWKSQHWDFMVSQRVADLRQILLTALKMLLKQFFL